MKKVLFIIPELAHGGTNKCLENLLPFISKKYQIYIVPLEKEGIYKKVFSEKLTLLSEKYYFISKSLVYRVVNKFTPKVAKKILGYFLKNEVIKIQNTINPDVVIAYQEGLATLFASFFSTYKIAWVHCDYKLYNTNVTKQNEYNIYKKFNHIICVSKSTLNSFRMFYPEFKSKTDFIYNIIDDKNIIRRSNEIISDPQFKEDKDTFTLLSIGRYCHVKQFERIPLIVNEILEHGINRKICWYVIGDGNKKLITYTRKQIKKYNLTSIVVLLGAKINPYPYINKSNLVVSLSKSEAYPNVINESKILHVPVLSTNYPSATELIQDEFNGLVRNIIDFPSAIIKLINNQDNIYNNIKNNISDFEYDNNDILAKIYELIDTRLSVSNCQ